MISHIVSPAPRRVRERRDRRTSVVCETLETRQLLSTATLATTGSPAVQSFLQVLPMQDSGSAGLSPQQVDSAYGISGVSFAGVSGNGSGQTIAIVDAYNDPTIKSDLAAFDAHYGLAAPPSFRVDNLGSSMTDSGWDVETALDVEWAHAVAPQANIVLVEASSDSLNALVNAVTAASSIPGVSVVSMSWGTSEFYGEWNDVDAFATPGGHTNETFVAASGDSGAWSGPTFPSVLQNVLAVGGTGLAVNAGGSYQGETGWAGSTGGFSGLDNGFADSISAPSYQVSAQSASGLNYGLRTTPDVSFNADPGSGVAVFDSVPYDGGSGWFDVGGTSAAAPAWAGLVAITDQGLAAAGKSSLTTSQLLTDLYSLPGADYHDVTSGFNGYSAGTGYDLVTGLGTPVASKLVPGLLAANGVAAATTTATASMAANHAAGKTSAAHNAIVAAGSMAGPLTTATTSTASVSPAAAIAALPVSSASSTAATTTSGPSQPAAAVIPSGSSVGLGQGLSSRQTASKPMDRTLADEVLPVPTDLIRVGPDGDLPAPGNTAPNGLDAESPDSGPEGSPARFVPTNDETPVSPRPDFAFSFRPGADWTLDRLIEKASGPRWEPGARREEEAPAPTRRAEVSLAGLAMAGAVAAFGHRVVMGQSPRRRPMTVAFRARGR